jgi:uncharacterized membrane protein YkoI
MSMRTLILAVALLGVPGAALAMQHTPAHAQSGKKPPEQTPKPLTLEQAVQRVQNRTGGKVLKADKRRQGRVLEYRIKVLTPKGHVRVIIVRSDQHGNGSN